jgi:hypothetical protein
MIVLIWPVVIDSAAVLAGRLLGRAIRGGRRCWRPPSCWPTRRSIEPIAVKAGLWRWTEPGLFDVPPIGILGWSIFAGGGARGAGAATSGRAGRAGADAAILVVGPAVSHVGAGGGVVEPVPLDSTSTVPAWPVVAVAWTLARWRSARWRWRRRLSARVPLVELLVRVPAAAFFFVLLALHGRDEPALVGLRAGVRAAVPGAVSCRRGRSLA